MFLKVRVMDTVAYMALFSGVARNVVWRSVGLEKPESLATRRWNQIILRSLVLTHYQRLTDGQTDKHAAYVYDAL